MSSLGVNPASLGRLMGSLDLRTASLAVAVPGAALLLYRLTPSYTARMAAYYAALTGVSTALMPVSLLPYPCRPENMLRCAHVMNWLSRWLLGWRFRVRDAARLRPDRAFVVVVNHQHSLDVLGLFALWPHLHRCTTLSKRELLWAGPFGAIAWLCGTTFINRKDRREAFRILSETVAKARETRTKVLVFPEGTRNHVPGRRELLPFRPGAFAAAIASGVPVLPVVISHYTFLDEREGRLESGRADVRVLEPIETAGMGAEEVEGLMERTREAMQEAYRELRVQEEEEDEES